MLLGSFVEQYDAMDKWRMEASSPTIASSTSSNGGPSTTLPPINTTILEKDEHLSTSPDHDETIDVSFERPNPNTTGTTRPT